MIDIAYLHDLRRAELEAWLDRVSSRGALLEIGAGTGYQASLLQKKFTRVAAVDLPRSAYTGERVFPVRDYDGHHLPYDDGAFDVVYTSHVVEHIEDRAALDREIRRVLADDGKVVHVVPTHVWRLWTSLAHYPALPRLVIERFGRTGRTEAPIGGSDGRAGGPPGAPPDAPDALDALAAALVSPRHGERGNRFSEVFHFRTARWRRDFKEAGWQLADDFPLGLFYTGYVLLGSRLAIPARRRLAGLLGSASHAFVLAGN